MAKKQRRNEPDEHERVRRRQARWLARVRIHMRALWTLTLVMTLALVVYWRGSIDHKTTLDEFKTGIFALVLGMCSMGLTILWWKHRRS